MIQYRFVNLNWQLVEIGYRARENHWLVIGESGRVSGSIVVGAMRRTTGAAWLGVSAIRVRKWCAARSRRRNKIGCFGLIVRRAGRAGRDRVGSGIENAIQHGRSHDGGKFCIGVGIIVSIIAQVVPS